MLLQRYYRCRQFFWICLLCACSAIPLRIAAQTAVGGQPVMARHAESYRAPEYHRLAYVPVKQSLNVRVFLWVNGHHSAAWDRFFLWYRYLGMGWVLLPLVIALAWFRRWLLPVLLTSVAIETVVVVALKWYFDQPRPAVALGMEHVHLLIPLFKHSFPSGDTALAFAIAGVMLWGTRWYVRCAWIFYALLIGYERMYVGVHFPLDVLAGLAIGVGSSILTLRLWKKPLAQIPNDPHHRQIGTSVLI